jgi:uncharacterized protein YndB with AHSA1/START domain
MLRIEDSVVIDKPPAEVFAVLTDPSRLAEWQKGTVDVRREKEGPLSVGERFKEVHAAMGRKLESTVEVAEYDAPRAFALKILDGPVPLDGSWRLESDGNGSTRLQFVGEGEMKGPMRFGGPLVRRAFARQFRAHHARLKKLVEA